MYSDNMAGREAQTHCQKQSGKNREIEFDHVALLYIQTYITWFDIILPFRGDQMT